MAARSSDGFRRRSVSRSSSRVAVEDLERLEENLTIMRDADTMGRLAESDAELARGEEVTVTRPAQDQ
jgi:antitoxin YefM